MNRLYGQRTECQVEPMKLQFKNRSWYLQCKANGLTENFDDTRKHHEIYLSDPRKTVPEKMKTVLRHPVKRI